MSSRCCLSGLFPLPVLAHLVFDFFSNHRQILGGFHADADYALRDPDHGHGDIIADKNFFPDFSRKYKHNTHPTIRR